MAAADQGKVPIERLQQYATGLLARVDAAQRGLRSILSTAVQQRLAAAQELWLSDEPPAQLRL